MEKITKILMANRGEISRRVQSTCRELGIKMVAIYSEGEESLPHATEADQAFSLGIGPLSETYLNQKKIIDLALKTGCQAIHPGYGFLSENSSFTKACKAAGLIFIGPTPEVMELMGDKQSSKKKMEEIQVPLIPGYHGDRQEPDFLKDQAQKIGFPVLIKASAGGGGKGMRIVLKETDFSSALDGARREAMNAFGDDKVLIEKYLLNPRHIEIQVFSDSHGNHLHLFERECSIQRRYQKIVEESPSPALNSELRQKMTATATKITNALGYLGAGTLEFMLDEFGNYYFLEMNTRLQVEHPVTEMITGLDLVAWQILVAEGKALPLKQEQIMSRGHGMEVRLYAEDPDQEFLPSTGTIKAFGDSELRDWRLDTGYRSGNDVSTQFDPMIAKLIVWGEDRERARHKLVLLLKQIGPVGLVTNRHYLARILQHPAFIDGETTTDFVVKHKDSLKRLPPTDEAQARALALALLSPEQKVNGATTGPSTVSGAWDQLSGFRIGGRL